MCSIGVTTKKGLERSNQFAQYRGPDVTSIKVINDIEFLHNLLHLTGEFTQQPFHKNNIVTVFNGEIYNYLDFGNYKTDGDILIDLYEKNGPEFVKLLDGEFAICLVDFSKKIIIISNDTFACKPLWYEFNETDFCVASYNSQLYGLNFLNGKKLQGNQTRVYDLDTHKFLYEFENYTFDINQYKNTYDDWISAFKQSIEKRSRNVQYGMFLGLSSGYDSGAIACELLNQNKPFKSYTITGPENMYILNQRISKIPVHELINLTKTEYDTISNDLNINCENFTYHDRFLNYNIKKDKASIGLSAICRRAIQDQRRIYFSGQGADEIISDYGFNGYKIYGHSSFGGKFPSNLNGFFPWHSFYDGTQIQYLNKEEYIAGHHGVETRYPFLDKALVQEFIWLDVNLKNSKYKSALHEYLIQNNFPFNPGEKIGFNTLKGLK
jgi:asparagine synthetase B (glutamine-hydrolysing)